MGTSLTGTKPKDTYDSLIKVGDNGPISGTAKYLSDGLGNDLPIAVSTSNVGIGTSSPQNYGSTTLTVASKLTTNVGAVVVQNSDASVRGHLYASGSANLITVGSASASSVQFVVSDTERMRLTANGLTFNGDTAAANALDDYEEGTWTMGVAFGGASVGVTYNANVGTYTKIGRQVTVNGYLDLTSKGSSVGSATITGLPFTIPNLNQNYSAVSLWFNAITFADQFIAIGAVNTTTISLQESSMLGVNTPITDADFANNSAVMVSFTYFV